ncbi:putative phage abortive infection protein [Vibrio parahaemolyticus]|uniref:putative phage abortive infection protein n=1 Tax=Vibrio parahaemolyticus TaxID=670 RepID=UPI001EEB94A5|nr:putative phage abortive infection protein [Vibrio parahaemolyticus]MCG6489964.1 putative phage abortive infection protein [Vibrio parahaemolyticus]
MKENFFISENFSRILIFSGAALLMFFLIAFCYKAILLNFDLPIKADVFGQFGDVVGGVVGSLWALAGVILFYAGLMEQRKDIKTNQHALEKQIQALNNQSEEIELQRREYEMARIVFTEQRDVLKEQSKTSRIQQFESNFYSLVDIYIKIRNELILGDNSLMLSINNKIRGLSISECGIKERISTIIDNYQIIYYENKDNLSHYLKTIYRLYKVIDEQEDLDDKRKYFYAKIVRSQFTEEELFLIYYNSCSSYGRNFRALILKYNILKHLVIMNKLEFKCFDIDNKIACSNRLLFTNWLDEFMILHHAKMADLSIEEPCYESVYKYDNIDEIKIIISLTDEDDIKFSIYFLNDNFSNKLFLTENFSSFFECYIYDRFILNNLEDIHDVDIVDTVIVNELHHEYIFKTEKTLKVNFDAY